MSRGVLYPYKLVHLVLCSYKLMQTVVALAHVCVDKTVTHV